MDHGFGGLPFLFSVIEPANARLLSMRGQGQLWGNDKIPMVLTSEYRNTDNTIKMKNKVLVDRIDGGGNTGKGKTNLDCSL